jgi:predicted Zn-dependent protease
MAVVGKLNDETLVQSIDILYELNQIDKADELLTQADRLGRKSDLLDLQRLLLYQRQEREPKKVAEIAERLSSLSDVSDIMSRGLARYYLNNSECNKAITHIENMDTKDGQAFGILWRAMLEVGRGKEVRRAIREYIVSHPESYDTYFLLAVIEAEKGNMRRAETLLVYALDHGFSNMEELHGNPRLNDIFESMTGKKLLEEA